MPSELLAKAASLLEKDSVSIHHRHAALSGLPDLLAPPTRRTCSAWVGTLRCLPHFRPRIPSFFTSHKGNAETEKQVFTRSALSRRHLCEGLAPSMEDCSPMETLRTKDAERGEAQDAVGDPQ